MEQVESNFTQKSESQPVSTRIARCLTINCLPAASDNMGIKSEFHVYFAHVLTLMIEILRNCSAIKLETVLVNITSKITWVEKLRWTRACFYTNFW